jgi:hypothetical protein
MHLLLPLLWALAVMAIIICAFIRESRDRARNAPLRFDIEMQVCFSTALDHAMILGRGGYWIAIKGPKRLVVGTDAFMVVSSLGAAYALRGCESSIAFSQEPSRVVTRDWIVITGQNGAREVQLAVTRKGSLPEIWQALTGTGAAPRSSADFGAV